MHTPCDESEIDESEKNPVGDRCRVLAAGRLAARPGARAALVVPVVEEEESNGSSGVRCLALFGSLAWVSRCCVQIHRDESKIDVVRVEPV